MRRSADEIHGDARKVAAALEQGATAATNGAASIGSAKEAAIKLIDAAIDDGFKVNDDGSVVAPQVFSWLALYGIDVLAAQAARDEMAKSLSVLICSALDAIGREDDAAGKAIADAFSTLPTAGKPGETEVFIGSPPGGGDNAERTNAASTAFEKVFGRAPASPTDWQTASALNPNSYLDKNQGVPPEIVVSRIKPVPGQGVVRAGLFIPAAEVFNIPHDDLGDNRDENPHFDPESSRVSMLVDYENGLVIARQNPSVGDTGAVNVEAPDVDVTQLDDGTVRLQYHAVNALPPFKSEYVPEVLPNSLAEVSGATVNGDLILTPGDKGVVAAGNIGNYPSLEVYQDDPSGSTRTVLQDAANSGSPVGPMMNLPFHHIVGDYTKSLEDFQFYDPYLGKPLDIWQSTPLGSVDNPPVARRY
ncbi:hypothetical protein [Antrihabitans cavernicola]|uniref:Uncharacterized protein n=1 Tax=Antrihabitans cavernicola TaxID=2495913 RepID=A0A5A7SKM6_9NOCA|nr:hypothetical protein [Spelaeibacter cavernicola]KAA0024771.1 hypothetical protein FOY51_02215 [Spelaeibacter cavernicola]